MLDLPGGVLDSEAVVQQLFEVTPRPVAVLVRSDEDICGECGEAAGDFPDVQVVDLADVGDAGHGASDGLGVDAFGSSSEEDAG